MNEVWIEKYRPKTLDEVVGQEHVVERLKSYVKSGNLPHLLFAGPAGTGKTSCAIALARDLYGDAWRENFLELNASDERGIKTVRVAIKDYARTGVIGSFPFKIIFLDEADALTPEAQAALRRTMEKYSATTRFILSCNYSSKIIDPIQSRCAVFRFRKLSDEAIREFLLRVVKNEGYEIDEEALGDIVYFAEGDMRKAINVLQVAAATAEDGRITRDSVVFGAGVARPEEIEEMISKALSGDFRGARAVLDHLLVEVGLSGEDIVRQIQRVLLNISIDEEKLAKLMEKVGETEFRIVEGGNERIQIEALLAYFVAVGKGLHV